MDTRLLLASRRTGAMFASALVLAAASSTLSAQGDTAAVECNPANVPTQALGRATLSLQKAFGIIQSNQSILQLDSADRVDSTGKPLVLRDATIDLKAAISALTGPADKRDKGANDSLGRAFYLGQAYILMLEQPGVVPIGKRSDYGIATDSSFTIDLLAAADTQFTKIETAYPVCVEETSKWRQQRPWLDALNGAINAINSQEADSAEFLARRSLIIDRTSPWAYGIIGKAHKQRKDYDSAIEMFEKVIKMVDESNDTSLAGDKIEALYDIADVATQRASAASGAEKEAAIAAAIDAWNNFIPVGTRELLVTNGVAQMRNLLRSVKDTISLPKIYAKIMEDPSHYGESTLLNAGLIATEASRTSDAIKLFATVVEKNPYQRDALNNLAASYSTNKEYSKMIPNIDRLVQVDPNNANAWLLYSFAYRGMMQEAESEKNTAQVRAYTDSLVKYTTKADKLPAELTLSGFSHTSSETTLTGTITNKTKASKTYTLEVEFLDAKGNVVGTKTASVGPVAADNSESFTVTLPDVDAVAFRYKPLD